MATYRAPRILRSIGSWWIVSVRVRYEPKPSSAAPALASFFVTQSSASAKAAGAGMRTLRSHVCDIGYRILHVGHRRRRTILCRAMPRDTTGLSESIPMLSYMAASISQKAIVLSPTSACADVYQGYRNSFTEISNSFRKKRVFLRFLSSR